MQKKRVAWQKKLENHHTWPIEVLLSPRILVLLGVSKHREKRILSTCMRLYRYLPKDVIVVGEYYCVGQVIGRSRVRNTITVLAVKGLEGTIVSYW